jgi:KilA-N domain
MMNLLNIFKKKRSLTINNNIISIHEIEGEDYICLTDMARGADGEQDHIRNWLRNRNTIEFLGLWEIMHNVDFKPVEFEEFKKQAGLNSFNLAPKKWTEATNAKGIISKSGRYGGTYAHKDIAFEFGTWISPAFKLYLIIARYLLDRPEKG